MTDLSAFPITKRWPAKHPDRLQLYSLPTPNGVKVSIMLEEIGLPYEPHLVDIGKDESWTPEYLSLNPNGKIPAIIDPDGPGGKPIGLFESGAILLYLAEKTGKLLPADPARALRDASSGCSSRWRRSGPMFGQVGYFHKFAGKEIEDKRPLRPLSRRERSACSACSRRGSTDRHWIMGDEYTIADISHARLGAQPHRLLRRGRARRLRRAEACRPPGSSAALRGRRSSAGSIFQRESKRQPADSASVIGRRGRLTQHKQRVFTWGLRAQFPRSDAPDTVMRITPIQPATCFK